MWKSKQCMFTCTEKAADNPRRVIAVVSACLRGRGMPQHRDVPHSLVVQLCLSHGHGCGVCRRHTMVVVCADDKPWLWCVQTADHASVIAVLVARSFNIVVLTLAEIEYAYTALVLTKMAFVSCHWC